MIHKGDLYCWPQCHAVECRGYGPRVPPSCFRHSQSERNIPSHFSASHVAAPCHLLFQTLNLERLYFRQLFGLCSAEKLHIMHSVLNALVADVPSNSSWMIIWIMILASEYKCSLQQHALAIMGISSTCTQEDIFVGSEPSGVLHETKHQQNV
jgi:hypothetical protein